MRARIHRRAIAGVACVALWVALANPVYAGPGESWQGRPALPWKEAVDLFEAVPEPSFMEMFIDLLAAILWVPGAFLDVLLRSCLGV